MNALGRPASSRNVRRRAALFASAILAGVSALGCPIEPAHKPTARKVEPRTPLAPAIGLDWIEVAPALTQFDVGPAGAFALLRGGELVRIENDGVHPIAKIKDISHGLAVGSRSVAVLHAGKLSVLSLPGDSIRDVPTLDGAPFHIAATADGFLVAVLVREGSRPTSVLRVATVGVEPVGFPARVIGTMEWGEDFSITSLRYAHSSAWLSIQWPRPRTFRSASSGVLGYFSSADFVVSVADKLWLIDSSAEWSKSIVALDSTGEVSVVARSEPCQVVMTDAKSFNGLAALLCNHSEVAVMDADGYLVGRYRTPGETHEAWVSGNMLFARESGGALWRAQYAP